MIDINTYCADCGTRYPHQGLYQLEEDGRCYYCHQFYVQEGDK